MQMTEENKNLNYFYGAWCAESICNTSGHLCKWIRNYCFMKFPTSSSVNLFCFSVLSLCRGFHLSTHTQRHKSPTAGQDAFSSLVYKSSFLFTLALQSNPAFSSSLPSPFVITTWDMLADAIGFKDLVPQVVCVQFINLLWIILIY